MSVVLADLDAWLLFASRAPLTRIPKEEATRALEGASCTAADVAAVRDLPWRRDLAAHGRILAHVAPQDDLPVHLLAAASSRRRVAGLVSHRAPAGLPDGALCSVGLPLGSGLGRVFCVSPELHACLRARWLPPHWLAVVVSALAGTYVQRFDDPDALSTRCVPTTTVEAVRAFARRWGRPFSGRGELLRVLDAVADHSRSPMETALNVLLCLPVSWGGYGMARPELNHPVTLDKNGRLAVGGQGRVEVDLFWPACGVGLEYDGEQHYVSRARQERDRARDAVMRSMGLDVERWTWPMVTDPVRFELVARGLAERLGEPVRVSAGDGHHARREDLRRAVLGPHHVW